MHSFLLSKTFLEFTNHKIYQIKNSKIFEMLLVHDVLVALDFSYVEVCGSNPEGPFISHTQRFHTHKPYHCTDCRYAYMRPCSGYIITWKLNFSKTFYQNFFLSPAINTINRNFCFSRNCEPSEELAPPPCARPLRSRLPSRPPCHPCQRRRRASSQLRASACFPRGRGSDPTGGRVLMRARR